MEAKIGSKSITPGNFCTSQGEHSEIYVHRGMCGVI